MAFISHSQRSLMSEDSGFDAAAMEDHTEMWVSEAQDLLDKHQLDEAETLFCRVLQDLTDANPEKERLAVSTLIGLAEIYSKRGRSKRYNLLEWYKMLMYATTFQEEVQVVCQKVLNEPPEGMSVSMKWIEDTKNNSSMQLNVLENTLINSMEHNVKHAQDTRKAGQDSGGEAQIGWLRYLQKYCCEKKDSESKEEESALHANTNDGEASEKEKEPKVHRKINFDQVQSAILTLVKEITADIRQRTRRRNLPEATLKRSLSFEMINKLSPAAEHTEIISMFENAIIYEESDKESPESESGSRDDELGCDGAEEDEAFVNDPYPMEIIPRDSATGELQSSDDVFSDTIYNNNEVYTNSTESSRYTPDSGTHQGIKTITLTPQMGNTTNGQSPDNRVIQERSSHALHSAHKRQQQLRSFSAPQKLNRQPSEEISGDRYDIPGILTIWRSYQKPASLHHKTRRYSLTSFEEVSPLTETSRFFETSSSNQIQEVAEGKYMDQNLLSEDRMKNTLGCTIAKVAERLQKETKYEESIELFKFSMGLFQELPISQINPNVLGSILKNVGIIKCHQGDIEGGSQLMEEAMVMFGAEEEDNIYVAETLYELGNAYMAEHWKESSLFDHVMKLVKNDIDNEVQLELNQDDIEGHDVTDDMSDSDCSESGESYTVCTHEAMGCYNQALSILSKLRKQDEDHTSLYVDVLTKLADCCIMASDYDKAILCYEEAVYLFRNAFGSASLPNNAHALSMLGTANFLLANYPKAVSMYETANILQQHLQDGDEVGSFGNAFTLTMLGISFYTMKHYQKCIGWCLRAYETYKTMYKDKFALIESLNQWFIIQNLYTLGFSYSTINFHDQSLYYLKLSLDLIQMVENKDIRQLVKVLKSTADVYNSTEDHECALNYYNEALEESHALGDEKTATALQNQLLNKIAGVHVSNREYGTAAEYLEQALDYQKNVQSSIRGDLLGMMHKLGITYTLSGDIDRAIECYRECYETYQDLHGSPTNEMTKTLCNLGILYHVKACIQDEGEIMEEEYLQKAEECYQEAVRLDPYSGVCVQYANFLYQQGQSDEALLVMLPLLFSSKNQDCGWLVYNGVEQAVLPDHLQHEMTNIDEFTIQTSVFANFLAILCFKQLLLFKDAEDCLIQLYEYVTCSPISLNHSLLGYSLLEMNMYEEAMESFLKAAYLQDAKELPLTNMCISVYLWIYGVIVNSAYGVWYQFCKPFEIDMPVDEEVRLWSVSQQQPSDTFEMEPELTPSIHTYVSEVRAEIENTMFENEPVEDASPAAMRDSGYYEHVFSKSSQRQKHHEQEQAKEPVVTSSSILDAVRRKTERIRNKMEGKETDDSEPIDILTTIRLEAASRFAPTKSPRNTSNLEPFTEKDTVDISESGYLDDNEEDEQWITQEETIETPVAILNTIGASSEITLDYNDEQEVEDDEETWITEESVAVETPLEILKMMGAKGSYVSDIYEEQRRPGSPSVDIDVHNGNAGHPDSEWGLHSEITIETPTMQAKDHQEEEHYSDEWITIEDVVETPAEVLMHLQSQSAMPLEPEEVTQDTDDHEEEWISEEVTVELPADILQQIRSQQQGSRIPWRTETSNGMDEEGQEEMWVTTEETCEMPAEVLQFIKEQESKHQQSSISAPVQEPEVSPSRTSAITLSTQPRDTGYSSYSSRYSQSNRWSSQRDQTPKEEPWNTITEETITTPTPVKEPEDSPSQTSMQETSMTHSTEKPRDYNYSSYSSRYSQSNRWSSHRDQTPIEETWNTFTEESVSTPTSILNAINGNTQSNSTQPNTAMTSYGQSQEYNQNSVNNDEEEEVWETWETTEETVEAPPELLAILAQQQHRS